MRTARHLILTAAAALALAAPAQAQAQSQPQHHPRVEVPGGTVEGTLTNNNLDFRGIPFAAPPVASLRWRAPQPVVPWAGVRDASRPAPACLQNDQGWNRADYVYASEDCLTLDIGTQSLSGRRPVIVWIHGGSNRAGSPTGMSTTPLVGRGAVVVGIRYRLGAFGFLSHRAFAAEANGASGNYGLMDQVAALAWIRANIARFGGDPDNITVTGESAGSQDVSLLLLAPSAGTLFHKAGLESGTPGFGLASRPLADALAIGDQMESLLGLRTAEELRRASPNAILAADLQLHDPALPSDSYLWIRSTIDGAFLPADPADLIAQSPRRPVIIGSNLVELDLPGGAQARDAYLAATFGPNAAAAGAFYRLDRPDPAPHPRLGSRDQIIATDATFRCPAGRFAALLAAQGAPVWRYEFDAAPDGGMTRHAIEISYIFGPDRVGGVHLADYWLNFARTGNPNGPGLARWPLFTPSSRRHLLFDAEGATERTGLRDDICALQQHL